MSQPSFRSAQRAISEITRRGLLDLIRLRRDPYHGNLSEIEFLDRLYRLDEMESFDGRRHYNTCRKDIVQHTVANQDWDNDWVFADPRFELAAGPDEVLLRFLAETLHPLVRDHEAAQVLGNEYNALLRADGWHLLPVAEISGRPVYGPVPFAADGALVFGAAKSIRQRLDSQYLGVQITRLQQGLQGDPELAIGTAKEFLESIAKTVLQAKGVEWTTSDSLPQLVKRAIRNIEVVPPLVNKRQETGDSLRVMVNNLGSCVDKLAELRNWHGTGHGKDISQSLPGSALDMHHARLVVGIAVLLAQFVLDCLESEGLRLVDVVPSDAAFRQGDLVEFDPFAEE